MSFPWKHINIDLQILDDMNCIFWMLHFSLSKIRYTQKLGDSEDIDEFTALRLVVSYKKLPLQILNHNSMNCSVHFDFKTFVLADCPN